MPENTDFKARSTTKPKSSTTAPVAQNTSGQSGHAGLRPVNNRRVYNRVARFMEHVTWYGFRSQARLAKDAGVSQAALSRFLSGQSNPSYALVDAVSRALETRLGRHIPPRELVSLDGEYPTKGACDLLGCRNCTPRAVYESDGFSRVKSGQFRCRNAAPKRRGSGKGGA